MAYYCKGKRQICENPAKCSGCRYFDSTGGYNATNADRIRAMTDEELAHFLAWHWNKKDYGLEWLKQPAEQKVIIKL